MAKANYSMSNMRAECYILLTKTFFTLNGIEYANTISHEHISLWPNYDEAIQKLKDCRNQIEEIGYKLSGSDTGGEKSPLIYQCRLEHPDGKAVVCEVIRKTVEGDLFTW